MRANASCLALFLAIVAAVGCEREAPPNPLQPAPLAPAPSPTTPTSILKLTGKSGEPAIDFGNVEVGEERDKQFLICNDGAAAMRLEGMSEPDGFLASWDVWENGDLVPPGQCFVGYSYFAPTRTGRYEGSVVLKANHSAGTNTIPIQGIGTAPARPPLTVFGEGVYAIGLVVAPGRYHADPNGQCQLWRHSRYFPKSEADIIGESATWVDPGHWIVDILPSDTSFVSWPGCGWWDQWPGKGPSAATIPHGAWEVNRHIQPGRYETQSQPGCHWERLRNFQWRPDSVIERQETSTGGMVSIDILGSDAGFLTSPECGVWKRTR